MQVLFNTLQSFKVIDKLLKVFFAVQMIFDHYRKILVTVSELQTFDPFHKVFRLETIVQYLDNLCRWSIKQFLKIVLIIKEINDTEFFAQASYLQNQFTTLEII